MPYRSAQYIRGCQILSVLIGILMALIGGIILIGRFTGMVTNADLGASGDPIRNQAALSLLLLGISLSLFYQVHEGRFLSIRKASIITARVLAIVVVVWSAVEFVSGLNLGIDNLISGKFFPSKGSFHFSSMKFKTAFSFFMIGLSLFLARKNKQKNKVCPFSVLALIALLSDLLIIYSYAYGEEFLYGISTYIYSDIPMAVITLLLAVGVILICPDRGFMEIIHSDYTGGMIARRLIPLIMVLPLLLGWLHGKGQKMGFLSAGLGDSIVAGLNTIIFLGFVLWYAASLNQTEIQREEARKENEERGKREMAMKENNVRLEQLNQVRTEFTSMVSHELKAPLTVIKEGVSMMLEGIDGPITPGQKETLTITQENIERLTSMINEILEFSRLESGQMPLYFQKGNLNTLVEEVYDFMNKAFSRKGVCFVQEMPPEKIQAIFDREKIRQILINLLHNALKFTKKGGTVWLRLKFDQDAILLEVEDTGFGIRKEDQEKIFRMYEQSSTPDMREIIHGTGIGLSVCKKFTELHQGHIHVESELGHGSKFVVTFPSNLPLPKEG